MAVYSYSDELDPPAPVVSIDISFAAIASTTGTSSAITVRAVGDTGSEITVVPALVIQDLAVDISSVGRATGVGGPSPASTLYTVLAWEEDFSLLDRDAIKDWKLLLDGPNGALTIYR
jgi:hypothetical protein